MQSKPTTGKKADLINACNLASEAAIRLVKPGNTNTQVTEALDTIAKEFGCVAVQSMTSHQLLRNVHDGPNQIVQNPTEDSKIATVTFEQGQVYAINVMLSSGAGKVKPSTTRTTVYKRNPDAKYQLKMKASRAVFSQIQKECGTMAFCLSQLEDEKLARMGIIECQTHGLVSDYKVLHEEAGTDVAQFGFTVLLMPNGPLKIAQYPFAADMFVSEISLKDEVLSKLIAEPIRKTKKKKN